MRPMPTKARLMSYSVAISVGVAPPSLIRYAAEPSLLTSAWALLSEQGDLRTQSAPEWARVSRRRRLRSPSMSRSARRISRSRGTATYSLPEPGGLMGLGSGVPLRRHERGAERGLDGLAAGYGGRGERPVHLRPGPGPRAIRLPRTGRVGAGGVIPQPPGNGRASCHRRQRRALSRWGLTDNGSNVRPEHRGRGRCNRGSGRLAG